MSDGFQYGDIIFLGLIAVFIALHLRAMLGRKPGTEDVWKPAAREPGADKLAFFSDKTPKKQATEEDPIPASLLANPQVVEGLKAIRAADSGFSTDDFLSGAKLAFEWVLAAYSAQDKEKLRALLSPERFGHFASEIDARSASGMKHETTLVSVLASDITEAVMRNGTAEITVQFTTEQVNVTRDKDKNIVGGDPAATEKVIDVWTFERTLASRDPNWKITAT